MIKFFQELFKTRTYKIKVYQVRNSNDLMFVLGSTYYVVEGESWITFPEKYATYGFMEHFNFIGELKIPFKEMNNKNSDNILVLIKNKFPEYFI